MKPAKIVRTMTRNTAQRLTVRAGANGTGKKLYSVTFWPQQRTSVDQAYEHCREAAEKAGYTLASEN